MKTGATVSVRDFKGDFLEEVEGIKGEGVELEEAAGHVEEAPEVEGTGEVKGS